MTRVSLKFVSVSFFILVLLFLGLGLVALVPKPPMASSLVERPPAPVSGHGHLQGSGGVYASFLAQSDDPTGPCDFVPNLILAHPHIDICYPVRGLIKATDQMVQNAYNTMIVQTGSFLWTTPLAPFSDASSPLMIFWQDSWIIVTVFLAAVLAWSALRLMIGQSTNWLTYANATEILPRIVFGLFAAYYSKEIFQEIITGSNALATIFSSDITKYIHAQPNTTIDVVLQIIFVIMNILLIIEEVARIAILYLLFAFSPILLFLASMRETQHFAKNSIVAAVLFTLLQPAQGAVLDVGLRVLSTVLAGKAGDLGTLNFLVVIAILFLCLMLFFSISSMALGRSGSPFAAAGLGLTMGAAAAVPKGAMRAMKKRLPSAPAPAPAGPSSGTGKKDAPPPNAGARATPPPSFGSSSGGSGGSGGSGRRSNVAPERIGSLASGGHPRYGKTPPAQPRTLPRPGSA